MKQTCCIVGKTVTLKPLEASFFDACHHMFSPTVRQWLHLPLTATTEQTREFLASRLVVIQEGKSHYFCIFDNQDKKLIGAVEIREPDFVNGQLGAWLNEKYWGGGRYQEALDLALKAYFSDTKATEVNAIIDVDNVRSIKAHQKYGFKIVDEFVVEQTASSCVGRCVYRLIYTPEKCGVID